MKKGAKRTMSKVIKDRKRAKRIARRPKNQPIKVKKTPTLKPEGKWIEVKKPWYKRLWNWIKNLIKK